MFPLFFSLWPLYLDLLYVFHLKSFPRACHFEGKNPLIFILKLHPLNSNPTGSKAFDILNLSFHFLWFLSRSLGGHTSSECLEILPEMWHSGSGVRSTGMCEVQLADARITHVPSVTHLPQLALSCRSSSSSACCKNHQVSAMMAIMP